MREIVFRGQTRRNGEKVWMDGRKVPSNWVYGGVLQGTGSFSIIYGCNDVDDKHASNLEKHVVYTDTLGQYTGLTDKNGTKIFEGDIVWFEDECPSNYEYHDCTEMRCGVIEYGDNCFYITDRIAVEMEDLIYDGKLDVEIIGNIHDNPELLKGGAE
jgi:uncharacterized phage protein (TIGR01671 family)